MSTPPPPLQDRTSCSRELAAALCIGASFLINPMGDALARELPGQARTERLRGCPEVVPDDYATLPDPPSEEDDEDADDEDEASSVGPGWQASSQNCIFPSLEITAGRQIKRIGGTSVPLLDGGKTAVSGQLNTTLGFTHVNYGWAGGLVTTIRVAGATDASLSQASIHSRSFWLRSHGFAV